MALNDPVIWFGGSKNWSLRLSNSIYEEPGYVLGLELLIYCLKTFFVAHYITRGFNRLHVYGATVEHQMVVISACCYSIVYLCESKTTIPSW